MKFIKRYVPSQLSSKDKTKQIRELMKSRKLYKKGIFYSRPKISSFKNRKSNHVQVAKQLYHMDSMNDLKQLSTSTGCSVKVLKKIINKGMGAYYSSGSRPSQTAHSWGIARLASSISSGKSAAVDYKILENGCKKNSKALYLAKKAKRKYGTGTRKVPKVYI
jgi:hypothetical protein